MEEKVTATDQTHQPPVGGHGEHQYGFVHDWLTPPDDLLWGDTQGLAQDGGGNIYVAHTTQISSQRRDALVVFDEQGQYLRSFGAAFAAGAHGLDLREEGGQEFLYLSDTRNRCVVKITLAGDVVWETGLPEEAAPFYQSATGGQNPFIPTNVAFAPNGDFYLADGYGSDYLHRFDGTGRYIRSFGGRGRGPGQLLNPHGVCVDERGTEPLLVVADRGNRRLQYLTLDGEHVSFVTTGIRQPCHLNIRGDLMLVPDLQSVVTLLDADNRVVTQLGDGYPSTLRGASRSDFLPGKFIHPHDALFLRNGDILVAEWVPIGRITLLRKMR